MQNLLSVFVLWTILKGGTETLVCKCCNHSLQLILKAIGGINFAEFFRFLHVIGRHRVDILKDTAGSDDCSKFHPRENMNIHNHVLFDLMQISKVISDMLAIPEFLVAEQEMTWECSSAADFLSEVNAIVGAYTEEWRQGKSWSDFREHLLLHPSVFDKFTCCLLLCFVWFTILYLLY